MTREQALENALRMNTIEFKEGTRKIIATRNDPTSNWMARLYVNNGETATLRQYSCKTYAKLVIWAQRALSDNTITKNSLVEP